MSAMPAAAPDTHPADATTPWKVRNLHVSSMEATARPGVTRMTTHYAPFDVRPDAHFTGHVATSTFVHGEVAGIGLRAFAHDAAERAAARSLHDALVGSGLLDMPLRDLDWENPAPGYTRIYVDRRQKFLEFETGKAPQQAQAVLDAVAAYEAIARR